MARTAIRKLEVFALAAHTSQGVIDYLAFFRALARLPVQVRTRELTERLVAITSIRIESQRIFIAALEGPIGLKPLIFNAKNALERIEQLADNEIVATRTHALADISSRTVIVEYNQRGAKVSDIQETLVETGRRMERWRSLELTLVPVPQKSFVDAIDRFRRIRLASVKLTRPNYDWTDSVTAVNEVADRSNALNIELTASAARGESLSKRDGVLEIVRNLIGQRRPSIAAAAVVGVRDGEDTETSVTLGKFIEHTRVRADLTDAGHVDDNDIERRMVDYLESLDRDR